MSAKNQKSKRDAKRVADNQASRLIVGVGASAKELDSIKEFLVGLEKHRDVAAKLTIIIVQHFDRDQEYVSSQLVKEATSLKVVAINKSAKLTAGSIYVAPLNSILEIKNGSVKVVRKEPDPKSPTIDEFLFSLAEDQSANAVGIVLSGVGSEGTLGLKAISDTGGLTFTQTVDPATLEDTPLSAAAVGVADHVLSPTEIAEELTKYVAYLEDNVIATRRRTAQDIESAIPAIAKILVTATNHNFKHYKTKTLQRRIQRRMQVLKISDVDLYTERLKEDADEAQSLFRELLISVTEFFRDEEAFALLAENVIPKIFADREANDQVRLWVSGCATGEEAYSFAILCREQMAKMDDPPEVLIFATDIDQRALNVARKGHYPVGIQDNVSPDRLKRYFKKVGKAYEVVKEVRELVLFSAHSLISDPPFSKLDLISCRNLLIYLGPHLQKKLIPLFHFSLRPNGFLFLGPSENINSHGELFHSLDTKWRISQRSQTGVDQSEAIAMTKSDSTQTNAPKTAPSQAPVDSTEQDLLQVMQRIVLDEFSPKSVVVDDDGQILCASSDMQKYLTVGTGNFQNNIVEMARDGIRVGLRSTLQVARSERRRVVHDDLSVKVDGNLQRVMITVQPMPQLGEEAELFMVIFHDTGLPLSKDNSTPVSDATVLAATSATAGLLTSSNTGKPSDSIIAHLERELASTREDLERSFKSVEATNEQLRGSNEELISLNEELQTANEELATSKEEIETSALAQERAKDDLGNLLHSTQIATIFLDDELKIRSFTEAAKEIYGLIKSDVGRPLSQLMPLSDNIPPLPKIFEETNSDGNTWRQKTRRQKTRKTRRI